MKEIAMVQGVANTKQNWCLLGIIAVLMLACNPNTLDKGTATSKHKIYTAEDFFSTPYLKKPIFSPDGKKILLSTNKNGTFDVFELAIATGELTQLTDYNSKSAYGISYFPKDNRFLYSLDLGLDVSHIFVRNLDGTSTDLTPDSTAKAIFVKWSDDKKSFYYLCNKRDNRYFDLYKLEIKNIDKKDLTPILLYENKLGYEIQGISKDERYLALGKLFNRNQSDIFIHDRQTGQTQKIVGDNQASNWAVGVANDESKLYYLTNAESEFSYLKSYDFDTEKHEIVAKEDWDINFVFFSPKNTYRALLINEDAQTKLKIYREADNQLIKIPDLPCGDISMFNFSEDEKMCCFILNTPTSPNDLYIYDFQTQKVKKVNMGISTVLDYKNLSEPDFIKFPSFDGMEIPALLYKPLHLKENQKSPALVWVHTPLGGQNRATYTPMVQYLVNQGYVVLAVNNRGSSGYGKTFASADEGKVGESDLKDLIAGKQFLEKIDFVAKGKVGIIGAGAYGGYMALSALTFTPTEFAVGVDLFGITNWFRVFNNLPAAAQTSRPLLYKKIGNPETDSINIYNKSPLFFAKAITQPLMIVQGANNPRVSKSETDQIINELKINKVPHEYVLFPDEPYFFVKKENEIKANKAIIRFLNKYLKGEAKTETLQ